MKVGVVREKNGNFDYDELEKKLEEFPNDDFQSQGWFDRCRVCIIINI